MLDSNKKKYRDRRGDRVRTPGHPGRDAKKNRAALQGNRSLESRTPEAKTCRGQSGGPLGSSRHSPEGRQGRAQEVGKSRGMGKRVLEDRQGLKIWGFALDEMVLSRSREVVISDSYFNRMALTR